MRLRFAEALNLSQGFHTAPNFNLTGGSVNPKFFLLTRRRPVKKLTASPVPPAESFLTIPRPLAEGGLGARQGRLALDPRQTWLLALINNLHFTEWIKKQIRASVENTPLQLVPVVAASKRSPQLRIMPNRPQHTEKRYQSCPFRSASTGRRRLAVQIG